MKVVILGGGFGGAYAATHLGKLFHAADLGVWAVSDAASVPDPDGKPFLDWLLDLVFSKDLVQYHTPQRPLADPGEDLPVPPVAPPLDVPAGATGV